MHAFNNAYHGAFARTSGGVGTAHDIRVAILDSGIDAGHQEFTSCIFSRKSFLPVGHDFVDSHGHGTHVAGLVHQVAPNAKLLIGRIVEKDKFSQELAAKVCISIRGRAIQP